MLGRLDERRVVPVLGPDLLTVTEHGRETLLYPLLARRLAEHLGVRGDDLPRGFELPEVSRRYLARSTDPQEIYGGLRRVFRELDALEIPAPLSQLAEIRRLDLFVTTTFDVLAEGALDRERFQGQRQTLSFAFAPNDKQDLPPEFDRLGRPAVFHLFGRLSGTPHSYAVTRDDLLEFMTSLQSKAEDSPRFLYDKLRASDLLLIGARHAEWLIRLLGRPVHEADPDERSAVFAPFGGGTESWSEGTPADFVSELHQRWSALHPDEAFEPPAVIAQIASSAGMRPGAVFLAAVDSDRTAAETLRDELDRAGVDVVLDIDDAPLAPRWEQKLRSFLLDCSVFIPIFSAHSEQVPRRFSRPGWVEAIREASGSSHSGRFLLPVVIDDTSPGERALPAEVGEIPWERVPGGKPSLEFVKTVVRLQRTCRSSRSA